jgi:hypothetical protein
MCRRTYPCALLRLPWFILPQTCSLLEQHSQGDGPPRLRRFFQMWWHAYHLRLWTHEPPDWTMEPRQYHCWQEACGAPRLFHFSPQDEEQHPRRTSACSCPPLRSDQMSSRFCTKTLRPDVDIVLAAAMTNPPCVYRTAPYCTALLTAHTVPRLALSISISI